MALLLPNSVFYHIPKTGGTWVREAVSHAGIKWSYSKAVPGTHIPREHQDPTEEEVAGKLRFMFVRNPYTYFQSYWCYKQKVGWDISNKLDRCVNASSFSCFIDNIIQKCPLYLSYLYNRYQVSNNSVERQFIGKQENLVEDLILALTLAGEVFDEEKIRNCKPINVASQLEKWKDQCVYTHDLKEKVWESEKSIFERFGYKKDSIEVCDA